MLPVCSSRCQAETRRNSVTISPLAYRLLFLRGSVCPALLFGQARLRVVPLSLSPSSVTREKSARKKWPREILGARSARKEGLPTKPESLTFHGRVIFRCQFPYLDVLSLSPLREMIGAINQNMPWDGCLRQTKPLKKLWKEDLWSSFPVKKNIACAVAIIAL